MFVIDLNYIVPLEEIDGHMKEHVIFLNKYYKKNIFIASGRKVPRTGGIILALGESAEQIAAVMDEDPFCVHNLATYSITEFLTSQSNPDLKKLLEKWKAGLTA